VVFTFPASVAAFDLLKGTSQACMRATAQGWGQRDIKIRGS